MPDSLLIATDLDRTLLPNGEQEESPEARPRFHALTSRDEVTLAYVSGRGEALLKQALEEYGIPLPVYAIGDVGTTIFVTHDESWKPLEAWQRQIAKDWNGHDWDDMCSLFKEIEELTLQEDSKQNTFKLSYYAPEDTDRDALIANMQPRLDEKGIEAALIWSIDEQENTGLMDVLPKRATKLDALQFLRAHLDFSEDNTVFCGDSGNDMPALTSGLNAVLVANARQSVKDEALRTLASRHINDKLYVASGGFMDMNGNYAAGILEGVAHFFPETEQWMIA